MITKSIHRFFYAWQFLTRLPAPPLPRASEKDWGRIIPYFTAIGFVIGLVLYLNVLILQTLNLPVLFSSLVTLLMWVLVTGNLHLDGLMDTFDGVGCTEKERKIEAMRDSRVGAYGATAGIFLVLFKLVTLTTILLNNFYFVILLSPSFARLVAVCSLSFLDSNYAKGTSSTLILKGIKKPQDFIINVLTFLILTFALSLFHFVTLSLIFIFWIASSFTLCLLIAIALNNYFNGHSGDTYGALIELSEVVVLALGVVFKSYFL